MKSIGLFVFMCLSLLTQVKEERLYPQNYFKSPLDIPLTLAGNFGEPRKGHFHTGLDFRTNEVEGLKVYAAADGYISRINVSSVGYGNALYITHPNGFVSVYGHLKEYAPQIMARLRKEQYSKESFAVDFSLPPGEIIVKQGEQIALSGNTGGSGGPHLHFEIRDAAENAINPLLFGINLKDNLKPAVNFIKFYPMDSLKYKCDGYREKVTGKDGEYTCGSGTVALNCQSVGISLNTYDMIDESENHIGIYKMKMYDGVKAVYEYRVDKMSFKENRFVISQIDYPVFLNESHKSFHKCFVEPGNHCPVYENVANRGILNLADGKVHDIKIEVSDYAGNTSNIHFSLKYDSASKLLKAKELNYVKRFDYAKEDEFSNPELKLEIPAGSLLDTVYFNYSSSLASSSSIFSKVHQLDKPATQVFDWFYVTIKTEKLNFRFREKAVVVYKDETGEEVSRGGKYENGSIKAKAREFGTYYVKIDTTIPTITPLNISKGKDMKKDKKIRVKISDDLSGISNFSTYIDDKWVVTDYDAKSYTLTHSIDPHLAAGTHTFKVVVTDERKNTAEYSVTFKM
ncbi:MAG: peptidase [Bacteroidota bacterium]|nr:peptidase [Bacteroidota bacterium]